jgi:amidase
MNAFTPREDHICRAGVNRVGRPRRGYRFASVLGGCGLIAVGHDALPRGITRCHNARLASKMPTPMSEVNTQSAATLARILRNRELGSRELLEHYVKRIERLNPALNAVVTLDLERARAAADAADAAAARGEFKGPLHGLPITIKDTFETAGLRTTAGATIYAQHVPMQNAVAVQRLIDAGAIVFGKTNTPAFAADVQTYNEVFGATNNPWDVSRAAGGSSGGAAVAVAAGFTAFELGSDIGGSIRNPVHYCGVYGHKPTFGIIPTRGHIPGPPGTLAARDISVAGPIARSADDIDMLLALLAGPLPEQAVAWRFALPPPRHNRLRDYRIAAWFDDADYPVDDAVKQSLQRLAESLRRAGARIDERARPTLQLRDAFRAYLQLLWPVSVADVPEAAFEKLRDAAERYAPGDDSAQARHARFATTTHRAWMRANGVREQYRAAWRAFFEQYDVLLTPVTPICAPRHDHSTDLLARTISVNGEKRWYWEQLAWISLAGMAYLPATVAPIERANGLPVGVQIIGPYLEDRTTIDFAKRLADVVGGFQSPPGYG